MPSTDLLVAALELTALERRRPEVKRCFDAVRGKFEPQEDEAAAKKSYPELCKVYKAGLYHDASGQAQKLLERFPGHPLLRLMLAQLQMNLKQTSETAALLYRLEADGLPDEVMLEMKARYCAATADASRAQKLQSELQTVLEKKEKNERETEQTRTAASSLTWAWLGTLGGFCMGVVGLCGIFAGADETQRFLLGALGVLGLLLFAPSVWWIRKNNRVLQELKVYERKQA